MGDLLNELQGLSVSEYASRRKDTERGSNVFADDTHGEVAVDEWASQLLPTQPFRHMHSLMQLGCANWVFPGAFHTRRQHSLGVSHLAVEYGLQLHRNGAADVTAEDLMLLGLAGLLHDVGHGPFSHVFESMILPRLGVLGWKHEDMSEALIDQLASSGKLDLSQQQWVRVKDIIRGRTTPGNGWWEELQWLPSVVAGDADMDRGDYLMRDSVATGVQHSYDVTELMRASKVVAVDGLPTICYAESGQSALAAQFGARAHMHKHVYQHQKVKAVECMVADAVFAANHVLRIHELASSPSSFLSLDDGLLGCIRRQGQPLQQHCSSSDPSLQQAAAILARADEGDYYPMAAEQDVTGCDPKRLSSSSSSSIEQELAGFCEGLTADDIRVVFAEISHGRKHEDPLAYKLLIDAQHTMRPANQGLQRPVQFSKRLMRVHLAKDCHKDPKLISRHLTQLQTALQRLIRQRADSQRQQQQQGSCSLSSPISSSIQAFGTLTPMAMPRHQALQQLQQQLASPVMTTPVVQPWSHQQQQQQQQQNIGRKRQRQAEGVVHQLGYDDNDEEQQQQQQLQQQRQQRWKGLPDDTDASLDLDLDMAPSQLSQLSQVHLPFVDSQAEEQQ